MIISFDPPGLGPNIPQEIHGLNFQNTSSLTTLISSFGLSWS